MGIYDRTRKRLRRRRNKLEAEISLLHGVRDTLKEKIATKTEELDRVKLAQDALTEAVAEGLEDLEEDS